MYKCKHNSDNKRSDDKYSKQEAVEVIEAKVKWIMQETHDKIWQWSQSQNFHPQTK